jgi:DNA-binding protein Fis
MYKFDVDFPSLNYIAHVNGGPVNCLFELVLPFGV